MFSLWLCFLLVSQNSNQLNLNVVLLRCFEYTLLDQFLSSKTMYSWNFMTHSGKFHLLMWCGDTKLNPGPRPNSSQSFSICYRDLNNIAALSFSKSFLLKAYDVIHGYDTMSIKKVSEPWHIGQWQFGDTGIRINQRWSTIK